MSMMIERPSSAFTFEPTGEASSIDPDVPFFGNDVFERIPTVYNRSLYTPPAESVESTHPSIAPDAPIFDILERITQIYIKIQQLIAQIDIDSEGMDENLVKTIRTFYQDKINHIRFQGWIKLGTSIAGGTCSIGSGAAPGLLGKCTDWTKASLANIGKTLDGLGRAIPQFGEVGTTFVRGRETGADGDIGLGNHRISRIETFQKNNNSILDRVQSNFNQILSDYFNLFRVAR